MLLVVLLLTVFVVYCCLSLCLHHQDQSPSISVYLSPSPCRQCLAARHMVRAGMSSLMIHAVHAPAYILACALPWYPMLPDQRPKMLPCAVIIIIIIIMPCLVKPYTDVLSLPPPWSPSLHSDRVGAMWNQSYITPLYEIPWLRSFDIGRRRHRHLWRILSTDSAESA